MNKGVILFPLIKKSFKKSIVILILLNGITGLFAGENENLFVTANQYYQQENYEQAIYHYELILKNGYENSELYYNLGNAYFRFGNIGKAILNYERAKRLAPLNDDIRHNLEIAKLSTVDKIEVPPRFFLVEILDDLIEFLGLRMNLNDFTKLVIGVYLVFMILIIVRIVVNRQNVKKRLLYIILPLFVTLILFVIMLQVEIYSHTHTNEAIILAEEIEVVGAPEQNAKQLFSLHQGTKVTIQNQLVKEGKNWLEIKLVDGKTGWVEEEVLERI